MRRLILIVGIIAVVALVGYVVINSNPTTGGGGGGGGGGLFGGGGGGGNAARRSTSPIRTATVDQGPVDLTVSATGNLVPVQQANLSFDQPGIIVDVPVSESQQVQAGQVVAREDSSTQKAALLQAQNNVKAAKAALQKLLDPVDPGDIAKAEANVKSAEASYSSAASSVNPNTIKADQLAVQQAQAAAASADYVRAGLAGRYATDDPNYIKGVAAVGQAQFNAQIAQLKLQQAQRGSSLIQATAQITYQQALLAQVKAGPTQNQIMNAQAALALAQMQQDQAQHALDKTQLVAPFAGSVDNIAIALGELSSVTSSTGQVRGATAMVLTDTSTIYADVSVDETDIGSIRVGIPVQVTLDALPGVQLTGKVMRIRQVADTTTSVITYIVRVALDPTDAPLKVGMTANAIFLAQESANVLRIPNEFIRVNQTTHQSTVTLQNPDGSMVTAPVLLGLQGSNYSEVIGGLRQGETIVLITANTAAAGGGAGGGGGGGGPGGGPGGGGPGGGG